MRTEDISSKKISIFQRKILDFYSHQGRDLPWRKTQDPYKILLSEFMLQQTQVSRVISFYNEWITKWPTIKELATASFIDVLQAWMGLGYNRRARYLHDTARIIVSDYNGNVLKAIEHCKTLPGIGKYTARAVRIFAANEDIATVDTNIRRIFIYEFDLPQNISDTCLFDLAQQALPPGKSRDWHNALMDYGSLQLTALKTNIKPKTSQSKFEGSDRQIRGKLLRLLLSDAQNLESLQQNISIDPSRLDRILTTMIREEVITYDDGKYQISKT
jgi:A/G-specific adenine glycosylase